jgi:hypothetical protein
LITTPRRALELLDSFKVAQLSPCARHPAGVSYQRVPGRGGLRRETRLAVRRDVRLATLRAPNISILQIVQ